MGARVGGGTGMEKPTQVRKARRDMKSGTDHRAVLPLPSHRRPREAVALEVGRWAAALRPGLASLPSCPLGAMPAMWPMADINCGTIHTQHLPSGCLHTGRAGAPGHTHDELHDNENGTKNVRGVRDVVARALSVTKLLLLLTLLLLHVEHETESYVREGGALIHVSLSVVTVRMSFGSPPSPTPPTPCYRSPSCRPDGKYRLSRSQPSLPRTCSRRPMRIRRP